MDVNEGPARSVAVPVRQVFGDAVPEFLSRVTLSLASGVGLQNWLQIASLDAQRLRQGSDDFRSIGGDLS